MYYTGITIGPVFSGIEKGHKTREIWYASFWFSKLAHSIIQRLTENESTNFIVPYPKKEINLQNPYGSKSQRSGVFPDRIIFSTEKSAINSTNKIIEEVISINANEMDAVLGIKTSEKYLRKFLRIKLLEIDAQKIEKNVLLEMNECLANAELETSYMSVDDNLFQEMLYNVTKTSDYKELFGIRFPSIVEIATNGLKHPSFMFDDPDNEQDEDELWNRILNLSKKEKNDEVKEPFYLGKLKVPHKYIAIIEADGDNFGKLIGEIYSTNPSAIQDFSKAISEFSIKSTELIYEYGGFPVYAGGDDLLWFQPILCSSAKSGKGDSFLDLIKKIDEHLDSIFSSYPSLKGMYDNLKKTRSSKMSMSYGVSIKYYKFPMHESLLNAHDELMKVKNNKTGIKDKVSIHLSKHSGQSNNFIIDKSAKYKDDLSKLLSAQEGLAFNGILYSLDKLSTIVKGILINNRDLAPFFKNYYNEKGHQSAVDFIDDVSNLLSKIFKEMKTDTISNQEAANRSVESLKSYLYFSKFLNQSENV
jgi:CRISPR-associated protein Cmr2